MDPIKIIIADDHDFYRQSLIRTISRNKSIRVIAEACNGEEAYNIGIKGNFDVALFDIKMPFKNGIELVKELSSKNSRIKIIILTFYKDQEYCLQAIKAGAKGILFKNSTAEEIVTAIEKVNNNEFYFSPELNELFKNS